MNDPNIQKLLSAFIQNRLKTIKLSYVLIAALLTLYQMQILVSRNFIKESDEYKYLKVTAIIQESFTFFFIIIPIFLMHAIEKKYK